MAVVTFDTLRFVEKLRSAGVPEEQAKAISEAFREATGEADLATKRDLNDFELRIGARIDKLDTRIGGELMLVKWMLGIIIAAEAMPWFVKLFT
ncbi:MAG: hypothetical protein IT525_08880 [Nitrosomonas sp.]|nr:hypothetical protein [Nitrosomonas sp.]